MTDILASRHVCRHRLSLIQRLVRAADLQRQRRALSRLDSAALRDIGVSRADADAEARRKLWDAPAHWYC